MSSNFTSRCCFTPEGLLHRHAASQIVPIAFTNAPVDRVCSSVAGLLRNRSSSGDSQLNPSKGDPIAGPKVPLYFAMPCRVSYRLNFIPSLLLLFDYVSVEPSNSICPWMPPTCHQTWFIYRLRGLRGPQIVP